MLCLFQQRGSRIRSLLGRRRHRGRRRGQGKPLRRRRGENFSQPLMWYFGYPSIFTYVGKKEIAMTFACYYVMTRHWGKRLVPSLTSVHNWLIVFEHLIGLVLSWRKMWWPLESWATRSACVLVSRSLWQGLSRLICCWHGLFCFDMTFEQFFWQTISLPTIELRKYFASAIYQCHHICCAQHKCLTIQNSVKT